jgi:hypothetical protein
MKQLKLMAIMELIGQLRNAGYSSKEIAEMPIYIGDDDELNGIHTAWYAQVIDKENENDADFVALINEDHGNIKIIGKAILIS